MAFINEVPAPSGAPDGFSEHVYRKVFETPHRIDAVWSWLNDPVTFTGGQVWPYRVEFVDGGFESGVLNAHYGPFINFAGVIGEVRGPATGEAAYRDLGYFYGSYALSPRLARPTRLQFWAEDAPDAAATRVTLQLDSLVRVPFIRPWELAQRAFWSRFPRWMCSALAER